MGSPAAGRPVGARSRKLRELDQVVDAGGVDSPGYVLYVTFPRVPQSDPVKTSEPDPGTCPAP